MSTLKFNELIKPNTNIEFVDKWKVFMGGSAVLILASLIAWGVFGLNLGVDFKGGTKLVVSFKAGDPIDRELIRTAATNMLTAEAKADKPQVEVQDFVAGSGDAEHLRYVVYTEIVTLLSEKQKQDIVDTFKAKFGENTVVNPPAEGGDTFFINFQDDAKIDGRSKEMEALFLSMGLKRVTVESSKVRDLSMEFYREKNLAETEGGDLDKLVAEAEAKTAFEKRVDEFKKANGDTSYTVRIEELTGKLEESIKATAGLAERFEMVESASSVSASVGADMLNQGLLALLYACLGILLYIALRFDFKYGPGAVIALVHDSIITIGVFAIFQIPFSMPIIAAVMTIIGYSVNDTIVVFDRIRENLGKMRGLPFDRVVNKAINETLSRTLLTVGTTLLTVISIFVLGGGLIKDFAFALLIGFVVGTYSSIYIASPVVMMLNRLSEKNAAKRMNTKAPAPAAGA